MSGPLADARRALEAARLLAREGFHADAVSRAYYAMFYAARDAVQREGVEPRTHSGLAAEFARLYVRSGRVPAEVGKLLRRLAAGRAEADYEGIAFNVDEAADAVRSAARFVDAVGVALGVAGESPAWASLTPDQKRDLVAQLTREMDAAAETLAFEKAAELRDAIAQIEATMAA